MTKAFQEILPD